MNRNRHKPHNFAGRLLGLLLTALTAAGALTAARAAVMTQPVNASGNRNTAPAVSTIGTGEGYSAVLYDGKNGYPASGANALAQTADGFIWIGSYAGLFRYDGRTFERPDWAADATNVRCLYVDSAGRLWIGSNDAGVFVRSGGGLLNLSRADGLASASVRAVAEDGGGTVYVATVSGVAAVGPDMSLRMLDDGPIAGQTVLRLRRGGDGLVYGLLDTGDLFVLGDGRLSSFVKRADYPFGQALAILPDPEDPGRLYVGTDDEICVGRPEAGFDGWERIDMAPLQGAESLESIGGRVWVCARTGVGYLDGKRVVLLDRIPMDNGFCHIMTDVDGNFWIASARQGVMKIVPNQFTDLYYLWDLAPDIVNATCLSGKRLFIGTENGLTVVENGRALDRLPLAGAVTAGGGDLGADDLIEYLRGVRVRSIIRDSRGALWISTAKSRGLIRYADGAVTQFTAEDGLLSEQVRTVSEGEDGAMLVATGGGVNVIRGDRVAAGYGPEQGLGTRLILTAVEGYRGEIVAGSDGGGLYIIGPDGVSTVDSGDGLPSDIVMRVRRGRTRDIYWIVTGSALVGMTPDYELTLVRKFPYADNFDLYENERGDLWLLGNSGVYVIPAEDLWADDPAEPVFFGLANGLQYVPTANAHSELTENGDLYIAGVEGVVRVNIDAPFVGGSEPRILLPFVDCDGARYYPDADGSFTLPSFTQRLTLFPYVLDYSLADLQVSCRLEGFDKADITLRRSELNPVDYTNLKIGAYSFVLTVRDPVRRLEQTASFKIVKGKDMSVGAIGSLNIIAASLLVMCALWAHAWPRWRGTRTDLQDRLFFGMIVSNAVLSAGEFLSYLLEYIDTPLVRELMIGGNTLYYISLVFFPYMLLVYLDYSADRDRARVRRAKVLYGIPCFVFAAAVIANWPTGWLFTIREGNRWHFSLRGLWSYLPSVPVWFYLLFALIKMYRRNRRLAALGLLLLAVQTAWYYWVDDISCTSFIYTMILVCVHLYTMKARQRI